MRLDALVDHQGSVKHRNLQKHLIFNIKIMSYPFYNKKVIYILNIISTNWLVPEPCHFRLFLDCCLPKVVSFVLQLKIGEMLDPVELD